MPLQSSRSTLILILLGVVTCSVFSNDAPSRAKRYILRFQNLTADAKWPTTIPYYVPNTASADYRSAVDDAILDIESVTCLDFQARISATSDVLEFFDISNAASLPQTDYPTSQGPCYSRLGKNGNRRTALVMDQTSCYPLALPLMLKALGMASTVVRTDRNEYLTVDLGAAQTDKLALLQTTTQPSSHHLTTYHLPYDYNSATHYASNQYGWSSTSRVLETKNEAYRRNIGHHTAMSYLDAFYINRAYCSEVCASYPHVSCSNGGYQDPKVCSRCRCPPGYGGTTCLTVAPSLPTQPTAAHHCSPTSSSELVVTSSEQCVTSPGYDHGASYTDGFRCNWLLKAPTGCRISMRIEDDFNVLCKDQGNLPVCKHWVELRYKADPQAPGPRACCTDVPFDPLVSEANTAAVVFDATYRRPAGTPAASRGFKLCYKLAYCGNQPVTPTPNSQTPSTSSHCLGYSSWTSCSPVPQTNRCTRTRQRLCFDLFRNAQNQIDMRCRVTTDTDTYACSSTACTTCTLYIFGSCIRYGTYSCCPPGSAYNQYVQRTTSTSLTTTCSSADRSRINSYIQTNNIAV